MGIFGVYVGIDVLLCEHDKKENEKAEPAWLGTTDNEGSR